MQLATGYWLLATLRLSWQKKTEKWSWLQCTECNDLNYRTEIKVAGGAQKIELKKYCRRERKHTMHKVKRK